MQKYFAAANSADGFFSRFDNIFDPCGLTRTYILKGGCGTGKSTLMKAAAKRAVGKGADVEYYYCSSDPDSLDGVIMNFPDGRSCAIIDGTAPHTKDPRLPGALDEIVNLGEYLCDEILTREKKTVLKLSRRKSVFYNDGYRSLMYAGALYNFIFDEISGAVLHDKLERAADRLISSRMKACRLKNGAGGRKEVALSAITGKGTVYFDSFAASGEILTVSDVNESKNFLFDALIKRAEASGLYYERAFMPLVPSFTEAVRLPEISLAVVSKTEEKAAGIINMTRFVDREKLASLDRRRIRTVKKALRELISDAEEKFALASRAHGELEVIYSGAMDFTRLDECREKLFSKIGI